MQLSKYQQSLVKVVATTICLIVNILLVYGQDPVHDPSAPPPPKVIAKADQVQLDATRDQKTKLKLFISFAENHLLAGEQYTSQSSYEAASTEIGQYHALIDEVLKYLGSLKRESDKTRDLYKRLELALRAHGPRLTAMRRTTPLEYAIWIKEVEEFARKGRTEALNSFYGHTVVREPKPEREKQQEQPRKDNSLAPEKRP